MPRFPFFDREIVAVLQPTWSGPTADPDSTRSAPQVVVSAAADRIERYLLPGEEVQTTPDGRLVLHLRKTDRAGRPRRLQELAYRSHDELSVIGYPAGLVDLGVGWAAVGRRSDRDRAQHRAAQAAEESLRQGDLLVRRHEDLTTRDRDAFRGRMAILGALDNRSWGAFVRVETPIGKEGRDEAERRLQSFAATVALGLPAVFANGSAPRAVAR